MKDAPEELPDDELTIPEVCAILQVARSLVYRWIKEDRIKTFTVKGGPKRQAIRILRKDCVHPTYRAGVHGKPTNPLEQKTPKHKVRKRKHKTVRRTRLN